MKIVHGGCSSSPSQKWSPMLYRRNASYVSDLGQSVVTALAPRRGEHILDLGCGDGALTEIIADTGAQVVGIDTSSEQIAACRTRGLNVFICDGHMLPFDSEFDAVFSNAALHWMNNVDLVLGSVENSLKKGGRFVAELGGKGNIKTLIDAFLNILEEHGVEPSSMASWYFPDALTYGTKLRSHGFIVDYIELFSRPTKLPFGVGGWLDTFGGPFFQAFPQGKQHLARAQAIAYIEPRIRDSEGFFWADYVRLRFSAHLPK